MMDGALESGQQHDGGGGTPVEDNVTSDVVTVVHRTRPAVLTLFDQLPTELLATVLGWLRLDSLYIAARVCQRWRVTVTVIMRQLDFVDFTCLLRGSVSPDWIANQIVRMPSAVVLRVPVSTPALLVAARTLCPHISQFEVVASSPFAFVHDDVATAITTELPRLTALTLDAPPASHRNPGVSTATFTALITGLQRLRNLRLHGCVFHAAFPPPVTAEALDAAQLAALAAAEGRDDFLAPPPPLQLALVHVSLCQVAITAADFGNLLATSQGLQSIELSNLEVGSLSTIAIEAGAAPALRVLRCGPLSDLVSATVSASPDFTELSVVQCPALHTVVCKCPEFATFTVDGCFALRVVDIESKTLIDLDLTHCVALATLVTDCPNLTALNLRGCRSLHADGLKTVIEGRLLPRLEELDVTGALQLSLDSLAGLLGPPTRMPEETATLIPKGLSVTAAAAVAKGSAGIAALTGCAVLRAGGVPSRRMSIVGSQLRYVELTSMKLCRDIYIDAPCLTVFEISDPARELELDSILAACVSLEKLSVTNSIRPVQSLSRALSSLRQIRDVMFKSCVLGSIKLQGCENLQSLRLESCQETHDVSLRQCTALVEVHLGFSSIRRLTVLECPALHTLTLPGCSFDEVRINAPNLIELDDLSALWGHPPTNGVLELVAPRLVRLSLTRSQALRDLLLDTVLKTLTALTHLSLFDCGRVTEIKLPPTLQQLRLGSIRSLVRISGVNGGTALLPHLTHLSVSNVGKFADEGLFNLITAAASTLTSLTLTLLGTTTSMKFEHLPQLKSLTVEYCSTLVKLVVDCSNLVTLTLAGCPMLSVVELRTPLEQVNISTSPLQAVRQLVLVTRACPSAAFIAEACPRLNAITLVGAKAVDMTVLELLARLVPTLTRVEVQLAADCSPRVTGSTTTEFARYAPPDPLHGIVALTFREVRTRRTFTLDVPEGIMIEELKAWLASRTGLTATTITLVYAGGPLLDNMALGVAGLKSGAMVNLVSPRICILSRKDVVSVVVI